MTSTISRLNRVLFALVMGALPATQAAAFSTATLTRVSAGAHSGSPIERQDDPTHAESSLSVAFDDAAFTATARADASMGVLKTYAAAKLSNYQYESYDTLCASQPGGNSLSICPADTANPVFGPAMAKADFNDSFTITRAPGAGDLASNGVFVQFIIRVDGETSVIRDATDALNGPIAQGSLSLRLPSVNFFFSRGYTGDRFYVTGYAPVLFDTPMAFEVSTSAFVAVSDYLLAAGTLPDRSGPADRYNFEGIADFGSTITLEGLKFYTDAAGTQEFTDFELSSASGFQYKTNSVAAAIPEPQTIALLLAGLGVVAATRRRQTRRA